MKSDSSTKIIVDRIEGDLAVLVLYDDDNVKFNFPVSLLPEDVRDGDHLRMSFAKDEASKETDKKRINDFLAELKSK